MDTERNLAAAVEIIVGTSATPEQRKEADTYLISLKESQPGPYVLGMLALVHASQDVAVREQAAVLARGPLSDWCTDKPVWKSFTPEVWNEVRTNLATWVFQEPDFKVKKAIANIIQAVGTSMAESEPWPDLQRCVEGLIQDQNSIDNRVVGLKLLGELAFVFREYLERGMVDVVNIIRQQVETGQIRVIEAAYSLVLHLIAFLNEEKCQPLAEFIIPLLKTMVQVDPLVCQELQKHFIAAVEFAVDFFVPYMPQIFEAGFALTNDTSKPVSIRTFAVEMLMVFVEHKPHSVTSKMPNAGGDMVQLLMKLLYENLVEDDKVLESLVSGPTASTVPGESQPVDEEWMAFEDEEEEDSDKLELYPTAELNLDLLASSLGGDLILPLIFGQVRSLISGVANDISGNTGAVPARAKITAMIAICQTIEYLPEKHVDENLPIVLELIIRFMADPNYRVRQAALKTLGQVGLDHNAAIQGENYPDLLTHVFQRFEDPVPRVQCQAFLAFVNISEDVDFEMFLPFAPTVMNHVQARLHPSFISNLIMPALASGGWSATGPRGAFSPEQVTVMARKIQEAVLASAAIVASILEDHFLPYTDKLLPTLKQIVSTTTNETLCGRGVECLCLIMTAVKDTPHPLQNEAVQISRAVVELYRNAEEKEELLNFLYAGLRILISTIDKDFAQFAPALLEKLLPHLNLKPVKNSDDNDTDTLIIATGKDKYMKCSSIQVHQMEKDLGILAHLAKVCGANFGPYVQECLQALAPLIKMISTEDAHKSALTALGEVLHCSRLANPTADPTLYQTWIVRAIDCAFQDDVDADSVAELLSPRVMGIAKCIEAAGDNTLTPTYIVAMAKKAYTLLSESSQRRLEAAAQKPKDEESRELLAETLAVEESYSQCLLTLLDVIMKTHSQMVFESIGPITFEFIRACLQESRPPSDRALGLCICAALLKSVRAHAVDVMDIGMTQYLMDPDESVRAAACQVICHYAVIPEANITVLLDAHQKLRAIINNATAETEEIETAVVALFQILIAHHAKFPTQDVVVQSIALCYRNMPFVEEVDEGSDVYDHLYKDLQNLNSPFWGQQQCFSSDILRITAGIYKQMTERKTDSLVMQAVRNIPNLPTIVAGLELAPQDKRRLKRLERDLTAAA